jgi:hypothetical protein
MWANGRSSLVQGQHQPIKCQLNSSCGGEGVGAQGWRASLRKMRKSPKYTQSHRVLGMKTWLKLNCLEKLMKRTRTKLSIAIENFKISQVEKELELPKVRLKSENQKITLHKTDHNFVNYSSILILFTFLESRYKMLHFFKIKKCLDVSEPDKHQTNTRHFCRKFFVLFCSPAVSTPTPNSVGGREGYNISCSDIRYFHLRISVNTLPHCSYILAPEFWVWPK